MTRAKELDRIMTERGMTARQVGDLIGRAPKTVRNWRSSVARPIPERTLEFLRARLAAMPAEGAAQ